MKHSLKLLEHQIKPLEYIISRCKRQHGLILNHYMGTGKTITGIVFLNNYPNDKKVIILPKGYDSIWITEMGRMGIELKNLTFLTHDEFKNEEIYKNSEKLKYYNELLNNSICIVDEAHHLYEVLSILSDRPQFIEKDKKKDIKIERKLLNFLDMMYSTRKIILLTGTLMNENKFIDIAWLVNIAAAKEKPVLPFDSVEFENKYLEVSKLDKIWVGVIRNFLKINPLNIIPKDIIKTLPLNENSIFYFFVQVMTNNVISKIKEYKIKQIEINSSKGILDLERYKEILLNVNKMIINPSNILQLLLLTLAIKGIKILISYAVSYYKEEYDFNKLDEEAFIRSGANKYFSYFNYLGSGSPDYPKTEEIIKRVKYTPEQLLLLIKVIGIPDNLKSEDYVALELNNDINEAEIFKDMYMLRSKFIDKGRIIGNLYKNPIKFEDILNVYINSKKSQTVVYSNFYNSGILLFSKFLNEKGIKHSIFDHYLNVKEKYKMLDDFKNKKINMLLLHPDYYEGISIMGCKYLHILEPMSNLSRMNQLHSRVIRYKSHEHLELNERKVIIYQWGCTLFYDINKILYTKLYINEWFNRSSPALDILQFFNSLKNQLSPDDRLLSRYKSSKNFEETFYKTIERVSIDRSEIPLSCCIWTPDNSCSDKRLVSCVDKYKSNNSGKRKKSSVKKS